MFGAFPYSVEPYSSVGTTSVGFSFFPNGIVGANESFFGNFLLGHNPYESTYGSSSNFHLFLSSSLVVNSVPGLKLFLRALAPPPVSLNLYTKGAVIDANSLYCVVVGEISSYNSRLNLITRGSSGASSPYKEDKISLYIKGSTKTYSEGLNIFVLSPSSGSYQSSVNMVIPDASGTSDSISLYLENKNSFFLDTIDMSITGRGEQSYANMYMIVHMNPYAESFLHLRTVGSAAPTKNDAIKLFVKTVDTGNDSLKMQMKVSAPLQGDIKMFLLGPDIET